MAETLQRRVIRLEGTLNFRDVGGYTTTDGGRVRWGLAYRADALSRLSAQDWSRVKDLGIRTIVDFRRRLECDRAPTSPPETFSPNLMNLAIGGEASETPEPLELVMRGRLESISLDDVIRIYRLMVERYAPTFGRLIEILSQAEHLPAVFHCTAGKDRTGVGAALLLTALGVAEDTVLDDYELTNRLRTEKRLLELRPELETAGVDVEAVRPYLSASRPALAAALAWMRSEHGSVEGYLLGPAGVSKPTLGNLRGLLIEPDPEL